MARAGAEQQGGWDAAAIADDDNSFDDNTRRWTDDSPAGASLTDGTLSTLRLCSIGRRRSSSANSSFNRAASGARECDGSDDARSVGGDDRNADPADIRAGDGTDAHVVHGPLSSCPGARDSSSNMRGSVGSDGSPQSGASRNPAQATAQVAHTFPPQACACNDACIPYVTRPEYKDLIQQCADSVARACL